MGTACRAPTGTLQRGEPPEIQQSPIDVFGLPAEGLFLLQEELESELIVF
jgi:hypothetical protein